MSISDPAGEFLRIAERYRQMKDEELVELISQSEKLTPAAQQALATEIRQRGLKVETANGTAAGGKPAAGTSKSCRSKSGWKEHPSSFDSSSFNSPSFGSRSTDSTSSGLADALPFESATQFRKSMSYNSVGGEISPDLSNDEPANHEPARAQDGEEDPYEEDRKLITISTVWSLRDALRLQRVLDLAGIPFYMGKEKATGVGQVKSDLTKGVDVQIMQVGAPWAFQAMQNNYFPKDEPPSEEPGDQNPAVVRCPRCQSTDVVFRGLAPVVGASAENSPRKFLWTCDACGKEWEDEGVGKEE